jgi:xanthine dehydrogenase molybdenum-binding subunit
VGAERIDWKKKRAEKKEGLRRRGVGMAVMMHPSNVYPLFMEHSSASIKLNEDGSATVIVGASEQGQGTLAVVKQIAAEELGVGSENVRVVTGDTDITPFDMGTYGSRTTYVLGHAVHGAAREAKGQILARAAKMLEVSTNELEIGAGQIYVREQPEKGISVAEVARASIYDQQGEASAIVANYSYNPASSAPSFQAAFAEVEVDTETGEVTVLKVVIAHDIGRAINPAAAEGQLEGSVVQGIGYALTEDFVVDSKTGKTLSDSFLTYKIPSTLDLPEIEVILVEEADPTGPFGAKGVGESGSVATAPAIANAIYNATGVRVTELPMTPERVLKALKIKS